MAVNSTALVSSFDPPSDPGNGVDFVTLLCTLNTLEPNVRDSIVDRFNRANATTPMEDFIALMCSGSSGEGDNYVETMQTVTKVVMSVVYVLMIVICGVGNILFLVVVVTSKQLRKMTDVMIANLLLSDLVVALLCAPLNLVTVLNNRSWVFGSFLCPVVTYMNATSLYVSTNTLLAIAIDRLIVVANPLSRRTGYRTISIAFTIVIMIWVISGGVAVPVAMVTENQALHPGGNISARFCLETWEGQMNRYTVIYKTMTFALEFVVPILIMCVCYSCISCRLWHRQVPGVQLSDQEDAISDSKKRCIRRLVIVTAFFFLLWAPYYAVTLWWCLQTSTERFLFLEYQVTFAYVVESLSMSNSIVDTVVYVFLNRRVMKEAKQLYHEWCRTTRLRKRTSVRQESTKMTRLSSIKTVGF